MTSSDLSARNDPIPNRPVPAPAGSMTPLEIETGGDGGDLDVQEVDETSTQEPPPSSAGGVEVQQLRKIIRGWMITAIVMSAVAVTFVVLYILCELEPPPPPAPPDFHPEVVGQWKSVVPEDNGASIGLNNLGMQSVHAILLPSGRVLMTPGSSFRNDKKGTKVFPDDVENVHGAKMEGLFDRSKDPFLNVPENVESYYKKVNNAGIYDPVTNEFYRVSHPVPEPDNANNDKFVPTDLFCTGHLQLPDGNALFVGGTQFYDPFFSGHRATYVYDWIQDIEKDWASFDWTKIPSDDASKRPWSFVGFMDRGRWYPSLVPLMDGRFVIVGGFTDFQNLETSNSTEDMYKFEVNDSVDFYDYRTKTFVNKVVSGLDDSPFKTELNPEDLTDVAECKRCNTTGALNDVELGNCYRQCDEYKYDTFKLYPRMVLMPDGHRIFFTRDGDFNSMRDPNAKHMRNTKFTYIMDIGSSNDPKIEFKRGPDLPVNTLNAGTIVRDPTDSKRIFVSGGMANSGGFYAPSLLQATDSRCMPNDTLYDFHLANQFLGGRGSRGLLTYVMPNDDQGLGKWEPVQENFLGTTADSDRTMHYKLILPNKQLIVLGGGNYWFGQGVRNPVLYTPNKETGGYGVGLPVAPHLVERLYHNTAILLADGTIHLAGGNANRASFDSDVDIGIPRNDPEEAFGRQVKQPKANPNSVDNELYFVADAKIGRGRKPAPAEDWTAEIYSPPYMFIDGDRRTQVVSMTLLSRPSTANEDTFKFKETIRGHNPKNNKIHYLFHSNLKASIQFSNLPETCGIDGGSLILLKLGSSTHGWDSGQQLFDIPIESSEQNAGSGEGSLEFMAPDAEAMQIVPAFYHLFYVDCRGKPIVAESVRFDNNVQNVKETASPAT